MALPETPKAGVKLENYAHRTPPEGYPKQKSLYAIPTEYKYPIDNHEHTKAAMGYWAKEDNRAAYSPAEQATIAKRIIKAAKKFGIEVSGDSYFMQFMKKKRIKESDIGPIFSVAKQSNKTGKLIAIKESNIF